MRITSGRLHPVYVKINISFERTSSSVSDGTLRARMDLESITLYRGMKHFGTVEIDAEINKVHGEGTGVHVTITLVLRKHSCPHSSERTEEAAEIGSSDPIDHAILQALNEQPFVSLRHLAKKILIPASTIRYHLVNRMWYEIKHCREVPHKLSAAQKQKQTRVTASRSLLDL
jgi:hypothetical protein